MKKFEFPLSRVLEWRRSQARIEAAKLARLNTELLTTEKQQKNLIGEFDRQREVLVRAESHTAFELTMFDEYRKSVVIDWAKLEQIRTQTRARILKQIDVVSAKRRDLRLLERLHDRRHTEWSVELSREIDQQAEEAYLTRWRPGRIRL